MERERVCRVCLNQAAVLMHIFDEPEQLILKEKKLPTLMDMLNIYCETRPDDKLPPHICLRCASEAEIAYKFKIKYEETQDHFIKLKVINQAKLDEIKEEPVDPVAGELESHIELGCVKIENEPTLTSIKVEENKEQVVDEFVITIKEDPDAENGQDLEFQAEPSMITPDMEDEDEEEEDEEDEDEEEDEEDEEEDEEDEEEEEEEEEEVVVPKKVAKRSQAKNASEAYTAKKAKKT